MMRLEPRRILRGAGRVLGEVGAAINREIGPREHAILAVAVGVYLGVQAFWPDGALGAALVVGGGIQLGVILWTQGKAMGLKKEAER